MSVHVTSLPASPGLSAVRLRLAGDERLARSVTAGGEAAFTVLYERYHQLLYRYCRSLVGNDTDAQDVLQSTFARALVALRGDRRNAPLRPWLFRIAHNEAISLLRRRRPDQELGDELGEPARSVESVAEERDRLATLLDDLRALPERQRGALVMRELSGLPHEEIALAFGISVGAAKQTVLEARRSLQEFAEGRMLACDEVQRAVSDGDRRVLRGRRVRAHLRDCAACAAFAQAIPARRGDLLALAPALPAGAAMQLLRSLTRGTGPGPGGTGGISAAAGGKGVGAVVSLKGLATGAAVIATTAAGAAGVIHQASSSPGGTERAGAPATAVARDSAATTGRSAQAGAGTPEAAWLRRGGLSPASSAHSRRSWRSRTGGRSRGDSAGSPVVVVAAAGAAQGPAAISAGHPAGAPASGGRVRPSLPSAAGGSRGGAPVRGRSGGHGAAGAGRSSSAPGGARNSSAAAPGRTHSPGRQQSAPPPRATAGPARTTTGPPQPTAPSAHPPTSPPAAAAVGGVPAATATAIGGSSGGSAGSASTGSAATAASSRSAAAAGS